MKETDRQTETHTHTDKEIWQTTWLTERQITSLKLIDCRDREKGRGIGKRGEG